MAKIKSLSGDDDSSSGTPDSRKDKDGHFSSADKAPPRQPCFIIGIGASAGAQEPLEQIFTSLPPDCGLSFVVIMHIPLGGPSFLAEMLGRYSTMPVVTAEDGMALLPDRVQVIPAGCGIILSNGVLRLETPEPRAVRHPVDRFFETLAAEAQHNAIAVLLSGSGTDGAKGVRAIKEAGGTVIVQEPGSAIYPEMPRNAIDTGAAAFILPADEIAGRIVEIAGRTCPINPPACRVMSFDEELAAIFGILKIRTGHDFSGYKTNTVMRRIERRMAVNEVSGIRKYVALLGETPQEAQALAQDILIGVTGFFRDPEAFATIERVVLPRLFEDRDPDEPVRIWHACCATGEEAYSMAFLIREYLDRHGSKARVQIFATDLDEASIAQARSGIYPEMIEEDVGEDRLKAFFTRSGKRWQVVKQVREMIVFAHHSLIKNPPFSRLDLLVCRNFLIYINSDMQKRLIAMFHQVLKPGGYLFLGSSETVGSNVDFFAVVDKKWKIYRRTEVKRRADPLFPFSTPLRYQPGTSRTPRLDEAMEKGPVAVAERLLMERYSPPCVIVNERYEVVHVSTRLNRFLEIPLGEPSRDILRMAREELRPALRAMIHKAFAENGRVDFRGVKVFADGAESTVNLLVEPLEAGHVTGRLAMVVFESAPSPQKAAASSDSEKPVSGDEATKEMLVKQLEEQLRITHEQLHATAEQLEISNECFLSTNEELISMNEEFQSANEELQSTNEELETSKEELQAMNEELATVNAELQEKLEELNRANSDMENHLNSSEIATIFLDREMNIKGFTPIASSIFNLIPADIDRPFRHFAGKIDLQSFTRDVATVLAGQPFTEQEVMTLDSERCYLKRILPYRNPEGGVDGIVVTFIDITERKRMEEQTIHLASFPQLNPNPVLEIDSSGKITFFNPATQRILEKLGFAKTDVDVFIPSDLHDILGKWERKEDSTIYREIELKEKLYGETIFLTAQFEVVRIYAFDITEHRQAELELEASERRVRLKLESILTPEGDIGNLDLADIIDAPALQALVDNFYELTGMPMGLLDLKGRVLVGVGWQDACTKFHRINPETLRNCVESDVQLSAGVPPGEYKIYKCRNNMWDVATPVMVADRQFGNLFMGQFFFEDEMLDYEFFRGQARQYGFDEKEYIAALEAVPRLSRETLNTSMAFFMKLADIISKLSYSNLKLARSLAERDTLMESLRENEERLNRAQEIAHLGSWELDIVNNRLSWSDEVYRIFGLQPQAFAATYEAFLAAVHPDDRGAVDAAYSCSLKEGRDTYEIEHRIIKASGELRIVHEKCEHFRDESGRIIRSIGMVHDITESKQAEEEIQRRVEELRAINKELTRFNEASVGRELRMIELKKEVNKLCEKAGQTPHYTLDFDEVEA